MRQSPIPSAARPDYLVTVSGTDDLLQRGFRACAKTQRFGFIEVKRSAYGEVGKALEAALAEERVFTLVGDICKTMWDAQPVTLQIKWFWRQFGEEGLTVIIRSCQVKEFLVLLRIKKATGSISPNCRQNQSMIFVFTM